jgi:hypothetical protein
MKKDTVLLFIAVVLLLAMIGGLLWIFVIGSGSSKDDGDVTPTDSSPTVENGDEEEEVDMVVEDIDLDENMTFTKGVQSVGSESDTDYILSDISVKKGEEVLELVFSLDSDDDTNGKFLVRAENKVGLNVLEINLDGIVSSNIDIGFNESININRKGISKLTRIVNSVSGLEKFYLGVADEVEFFISEPKSSADGTMVFSIFVKYPSSTFTELDMVNNSFSTEDFSYEGSTDARITNYKFAWASGVLRFSLEVDSTELPSVEANIDGNNLIVTFPSLKGDSVSGWSNTVSLPRGVTLNISRDGSESVYEFVGGGKEFRINGENGPNQVVIEIKI